MLSKNFAKTELGSFSLSIDKIGSHEKIIVSQRTIFNKYFYI